jgi:hypothetical protein
MKALKGIATIYPDYALVTGADNVHPDKLPGHVIYKVVISKIPVRICLSWDFTN